MAKTCRSLGLGIYLDIKQLNFAALDNIFEALQEHGMIGGTIFGSFRADWLAEIKALRPEASTSILFSSVHVDPVAQAQAIHSDYVHPCWERFEEPHTLLTDDWLAGVRSLGVGVVCWHEERPAEIRALQALGVNAICSDQPELLLPQPS
jgi:glycerophosphoryl diester phosphodiesterase